jgi:hypothetical protein
MARSLSLLFLKFWSCEAYVKKLQPGKLESKLEKCIFVGYLKETIGFTFYNMIEGKTIVAKSGTFLEKEFLTKGLSGRKIELDEIVDPSLQVPSGAMEDVPKLPSREGEGAHDDDHGNHIEETTRRSTRIHNPPKWFGNPVLTVLLVEHDKPANYKEAM